MAVAEYVTKLHAVCARCGGAATRSQRLVAAEGQLFVGGAAEYEARCRACFVADVTATSASARRVERRESTIGLPPRAMQASTQRSASLA